MLYFILYYSKCFDLLLKIMSKIKKRHPCIILLYHQIVDENSKYLSKGPVVHHPLSQFKKEVVYFKKNYEVVGFDEVVHNLKHSLGFKRPSVAITFDDGYLNNYTLAYPIIKKYNIPATIYVATSLIGTNERTWTDQIESAFLATRKHYFSLPAVFGDAKVRIQTQEEKKEANIKTAEALKIRPDDERRELIRELFAAVEVNGDHAENLNSRMMLDWNEVKRMAENGITFGSHTHTHPILSRMAPEKAKKDILNSKKIIEEKLGIEIKHFAFPNGRDEDFSEELRDYCKQIGFESIASAVYGMNDPSSGNTYALKRIGAIGPVWMLAGELVRLTIKFYWQSSNDKLIPK